MSDGKKVLGFAGDEFLFWFPGRKKTQKPKKKNKKKKKKNTTKTKNNKTTTTKNRTTPPPPNPQPKTSGVFTTVNVNYVPKEMWCCVKKRMTESLNHWSILSPVMIKSQTGAQ